MKFEFLKSLVDAVAAGGTLQEKSGANWFDVQPEVVVRALKTGGEDDLRIKPKPRDWWETESGKGPASWIMRHATLEEIAPMLRHTAIHVQEIPRE